MKRMLALLVVATVVTSVTGCGCCRRLRDTICRGAYCGTTAPIIAPAPAPVVAPAPVMAAPLAASAGCGCESAPVAFDAGCGYPTGMQMTAFGSVPCDSCSGGAYTLPMSGGGVVYDDPSYLSTPSTNVLPADPGPAPTN